MKRRGFTLVEILVVITIIGMLVALLLPAVNSARATASLTACSNNMRNFAEAAQNFQVTREYFPGYRTRLSIGKSPANMNPMVTWQQTLQPYLEKSELYREWSNAANFTSGADPIPSNPNITPFWELSVCPSDSTVSGRGSPFTSYVCNVGVPDVIGAGLPNSPDVPANGVFHDHSATNKVKVSSTDIKDGLATTLMLSENLDARNWCNTLPAPDSDTMEFRTGFMFFIGSTPPATSKMRINVDGGSAVANASTENGRARPSSNHPTGVNVAFCDGHMKFLAQDIDFGVYCLLITPNGAKTVEPGTSSPSPLTQPINQTTPLNEGSF